MPDLAEIVEPLLDVRRKLRQNFAALHHKLLAIARDDEVCRRLMSIPGVGPVVSLAYAATIDIPARFRNSKAVGPILGLTPALHESGESRRVGGISLCGDGMMRTLLYEAAQTLLTRVTKWSWLKAWAMGVARRRGQQKAIVALARRLAVIMHRIWSDGTQFRWTRCLIPDFDGASLSTESKDALWAKFCMGAPQRQRRSVERYSIVMSGRRPLIKGLFSAMGRSRVRSCLRPVAAALWPLALMVSADPLA